MKKAIILISTILVFNYACNAQIDTVNKSSDSLLIFENKVIKTDSIIVKVQSDTMNYAILYVYRPRSFSGAAISYDLEITNSQLNEVSIGRVKNNSKFEVKIYQEGKTQLIAKTEAKRIINIDVKFGKKYYLKCGVTMGILVGRPELNLIYPDQGELDYENVKGR